LNLRLVGSQLQGNLLQGPIVCNNAPQPLSCSQPSQTDSFNVTLAAPIVQNNWISVLIAQDPPLGDLSTYLNQIITLAPALTQIHLRVPAGATNNSFYADAINLFRTAYTNPLLIGFYPDNSNSSYTNWHCDTPTNSWQCVLNHSVAAMNQMNALVDPNQTGQGFNIFSLEQGDVEIADSTPDQFQAVKACLYPAHAAPGSVCPICTGCTPTQEYASPVVDFGDVTQSYGAGYYGTTMLDYTYPQFYNLGKKISPYDDLLTSGYFPHETTACFNPPYSVDLHAVDVDQGDTPYAPEVPCKDPTTGQTYSDVFTFPDPVTHQPSPTIAAAYLGFLMTQYPPIAVTIPLSGATAYITFSGEPQFFGAPGWTPSLLSEFYTDLYANFATLKAAHPDLFPAGGTDPATLQYAIWNFSSMLGQ
jgi:hypothetical protein